MLTLTDIVHRIVPPAPWTEGENIPWSDPAFSERMLAETNVRPDVVDLKTTVRPPSLLIHIGARRGWV